MGRGAVLNLDQLNKVPNMTRSRIHPELRDRTVVGSELLEVDSDGGDVREEQRGVCTTKAWRWNQMLHLQSL